MSEEQDGRQTNVDKHCADAGPNSPRSPHQDLLARVRAATGPDRELDAEISVALCGDPGAWVVNPSPSSIFSAAPGWYRTSEDRSVLAPNLTASLDAAIALVEWLLPGWIGSLSVGASKMHRADIWSPTYEIGETVWGDPVEIRDNWGGEARTPALALLAALLSALIAQNGEPA